MVDVTQIGRRARVLLVEDEPLISDIATDALEEQGFEVTAASNAREALHRLMVGSPIDILFTDVNLPGGMDGAALARRARELRPDLPVIYTSGRQYVIDHLRSGRRRDVRSQALRPVQCRTAAGISGGGETHPRRRLRVKWHDRGGRRRPRGLRSRTNRPGQASLSSQQ